MHSQPTSFILLAEIRHAELQAEAAQERLTMQALTNRHPATSIVAGVGHRLGTTLTSAVVVLHKEFTSLRAHMRTRLV
jgi:hypothetical protein